MVISSREYAASAAREDERMLLGIAMRDAGKAVEIVALCPSQDLNSPHHQLLLDLLGERLSRSLPIDLPSLVDAVLTQGDQRFGGAGYVASLSDHAPSTEVNLPALCSRIRARSTLRILGEVGQALVSAAQGEAATLGGEALPDEPEAIASNAGRHLLALADPARENESSIGQAADDAAEERAARKASGRPMAIGTGHQQLDDLLDGGLRMGELIVVAGRPGSGKTAFGLGVAADLAARGWRVGIVSLEMSREELGDRVLARTSGISLGRIRRGTVDDDEEILGWRKALRGWRMQVSAPSSATPSAIHAKARHWKARGLSLLVVDYLQLVKHDRQDRHDLAVGSTATSLKVLARDLGIPVLLLSQLNRESEKRQGPPVKRKAMEQQREAWWEEVALPQLSDLRDSGQIEQDADVVLFPLRAAMMGVDNETAAAVYVAKNRNGRTGCVGANWHASTASYLALP